jgi:hypothetical protein
MLLDPLTIILHFLLLPSDMATAAKLVARTVWCVHGVRTHEVVNSRWGRLGGVMSSGRLSNQTSAELDQGIVSNLAVPAGRLALGSAMTSR